MISTLPDAPRADTLADGLTEVRRLILERLAGTSLRPILGDLKNALGAGKMLRARLALRVGPANHVPHAVLVGAAAAVEMTHAASLLHDDVIDGARLRRQAPTFWVEKGRAGAILLGDLLVYQALQIVQRAQETLVGPFIKMAGEMCDAEAEQELILRHAPPDWNKCLSLARRKTGALFAFPGYAAAGADPELRAALTEAAYAAGTAYQLADDLFDAFGDAATADKTLGTDAAHGKLTAVSACLDGQRDPRVTIDRLCATGDRLLAPWPSIRRAWDDYLRLDFLPSLRPLTAGFALEAVS